MESFLEKILIYSAVSIFLVGVIYIYIRKLRRESRIVGEKIRIAKEEGLHEPVSLHQAVAWATELVFMPALHRPFRYLLVPRSEE